jgi:hydroxymethylpyrimidine pyrophosphatase-like HAD family hydrolase
MSQTAPPHYRLLALDVDGTLLDASGALRPSTAAAVARAARAGIRPVLCTGRRYRRAAEIAGRLALDAPLVCNSGALVKDPSTHATLWRADFDAATLAAVLALFAGYGKRAVSFRDDDPADPDFRIEAWPTGNPEFDEYVACNREHMHIDVGWETRARAGTGGDAHFHLCAIGTRPEMLAFDWVIRGALGTHVRTFVQRSPRYVGWMCEVLRGDASKWTAVRQVAARWSIPPERICAVGDDVNDIPMIQGAGLGVAMDHAPREVRAAADRVVGGRDGDGLAAWIVEELLAGCPGPAADH